MGAPCLRVELSRPFDCLKVRFHCLSRSSARAGILGLMNRVVY